MKANMRGAGRLMNETKTSERYEIGIMEKDSRLAERIRQINERIEALGIRLVPEPSEQGDVLLTMRVSKNARNAGKKRISFIDNGVFCNADEIRQMIKAEGADKTAAYLGCSRATLFRRLKESETDSDVFF